MDLITIDIGNSSIHLAVFINDEIKHVSSIDVQHTESLADTLRDLRKQCGPQPLGARTVPVAVSSVNPKITDLVAKTVADTLDQNILLVGRDIMLTIKIAVEHPDKVGPDRLLAAAAAFDVVNDALVVADFGTATTIDCVSELGIFLGGTIMPGLALAAKALNEHTAALPEVPIKIPNDTYGTNTESAIQCGIYYGAIGALREIVEQFATQLGRWPQVVVTGGYARLIAEKCDFIDSVVPNLCLSGLYLAYAKYRAEKEEEIEKINLDFDHDDKNN